jgi:hypothetical protein
MTRRPSRAAALSAASRGDANTAPAVARPPGGHAVRANGLFRTHTLRRPRLCNALSYPPQGRFRSRSIIPLPRKYPHRPPLSATTPPPSSALAPAQACAKIPTPKPITTMAPPKAAIQAYTRTKRCTVGNCLMFLLLSAHPHPDPAEITYHSVKGDIRPATRGGTSKARLNRRPAWASAVTFTIDPKSANLWKGREWRTVQKRRPRSDLAGCRGTLNTLPHPQRPFPMALERLFPSAILP